LDLFDLDLFDCKFPFDFILICTNIDSLVRLIDSSTDDSPSFVRLIIVRLSFVLLMQSDKNRRAFNFLQLTYYARSC
jgi:hypothetical protein